MITINNQNSNQNKRCIPADDEQAKASSKGNSKKEFYTAGVNMRCDTLCSPIEEEPKIPTKEDVHVSTPVTPIGEGHSPVRNVHVARRGKDSEQSKDDNTVVSELTFPIEMVMQAAVRPVTPPENGGRKTTHREDAVASPINMHIGQEDMVTRVLGMVEMSCLSTLQDLNMIDPLETPQQGRERRHRTVTPEYSAKNSGIDLKPFESPEWGVPPQSDEDDEDDDNDCLREPLDPILCPGEEVAYEDFTDERHNKSNRSMASNADAEKAHFEMVLTEQKTEGNEEQYIEDEKPKKRKSWLSPFRKDKHNNAKLLGNDAKDGKRPGRNSSSNPYMSPTVAAAHTSTNSAQPLIKSKSEHNSRSRSSVSVQGKRASRSVSPKGFGFFRRRRSPKVQQRSQSQSRGLTEKDVRYKQILLSLKERNRIHAADTEVKVRVPGVGGRDAFVMASDLIGNEYAEEKKCDDEPHAADKGVDDSKSELQNLECGVENASEPAVKGVPKTRSLRERFGLKPDGQREAVVPNETAIAVASSNHAALQDLSGSKDTETDEAAGVDDGKPMGISGSAGTHKKRKEINLKAQWKAVNDENTGRTYYYHRKTRETKWEKPADDEMYVPKPKDTKRYTSDEMKNIIESKEAVDKEEEKHAEKEPQSRTKKEKISRILNTMTPPNAMTVDRLVNEYEGREDELLSQLKSMSESKPFDEPIQTGRSRTTATVVTRVSSFSNMSVKTGKISEMTPQIKNTGRAGVLDHPIEEGPDDASNGIGELKKTAGHIIPSRSEATVSSIPSDIPVPRRRELRVEDFSSDRRAEFFDAGLHHKKGRSSPRPDSSPRASGASLGIYDMTNSYLGDNEETDFDGASLDNSAAPDSVSALSEPEHDARRDAVYESRRRALNEAIVAEDWDLAAALSDGLRTMQAPIQKKRENEQESAWIPAELNRFITANNWDAVADYIAGIRPQQQRDPRASEYKSFTQMEDSINNPVKRFGAKSQLQHNALHSVSSWESSTSYDSEEFSTEDSFSYAEPRPRRAKKAFVC